MIRAQIVQIVREEYLDDVADTGSAQEGESVYATSTRQLVRWCGEAEREACRRGDCKLIYDETTSTVCEITLVESQRSYALHSSVLRLEKMLYDSAIVEKTTEEQLDESVTGWRSYSEGAPQAYYVKNRTLYLDRAPSSTEAGGTLTLHVWREPLAVPKENEEPEIPPQYHEQLAHWMVFRAKSRADTATYDLEGASVALGAFESAFGRSIGVRVLDRLLESPGFLQHTLGNAYADIHRAQGSDWRNEW